MKNPPESEKRSMAGGNRPMKMEKSKKNKKAQSQKQKIMESKIKIAPENIPTDAKILETRDLLVDFGADEGDGFCEALDKLEEFLGSTKLEYEAIDSLTTDLMAEIEKLTVGLGELDDIFASENE